MKIEPTWLCQPLSMKIQFVVKISFIQRNISTFFCHVLLASVITGPPGVCTMCIAHTANTCTWLHIAHLLRVRISAVQWCHLWTEFSWREAWPQWWIDSAQLTCGHSQGQTDKSKNAWQKYEMLVSFNFTSLSKTFQSFHLRPRLCVYGILLYNWAAINY